MKMTKKSEKEIRVNIVEVFVSRRNTLVLVCKYVHPFPTPHCKKIIVHIPIIQLFVLFLFDLKF